MKEDTVLLANPAVVFRDEFDDFAVLFDPDTGEGYGLNQVGTFVWRLLDGTHSLREIRAKVSETFQNTDADVDADVAEFVKNLVESGLAGHEIPAS